MADLIYKDAKSIAEKYIKTISNDCELEIVLLEERTIEKSFGWVFFYNTRMYLKTSDFKYSLGGNAPIIIDREDGSIVETGTARSIDYYISQYELFKAQKK